MTQHRRQPAPRLALALILLGMSLACDAFPIDETDGEDEEPPPPVVETPTLPAPTAPSEDGLADVWSLWVDGPHLRGANIYQRRVYPELDGTEFLGEGPIGPPFTQQDFERLAALGANYVNISHPGLFTEDEPYVLDPQVQQNLDHLLAAATQADLFAVISLRTGPGRSEFSVCCLEDVGDWYDASYLNDSVWQDQAAQDAWVEMWRVTADRYRDNPIVVGYDLMVEPNANEVGPDVWDPEAYHDSYANTLLDWNQLYPRITAAIRQVDPWTPILIGGMGYSGVDWLPYLQPTGDPRTIYAAHQYAPHRYTHQWIEDGEFSYPGEMDTDWNGEEEPFDQDWLETLLAPAEDFAKTHGVPVAVNEFGVVRWAPGAAQFMDHQIALFEHQGWNYAVWAWEPAWEPWAEEVNGFNVRAGPDPANHVAVPSSELMDVIVGYWARNTVRPSSFAEPTMEDCRRWLASSQTNDISIACPSWSFFRQELFDLGGGVFPVGTGRYDLVWVPGDWEQVEDRKIVVSLRDRPPDALAGAPFWMWCGEEPGAGHGMFYDWAGDPGGETALTAQNLGPSCPSYSNTSNRMRRLGRIWSRPTPRSPSQRGACPITNYLRRRRDTCIPTDAC